jgi:hypothetical protein
MNNVTKSISETTEKLESIVADNKKLDQGNFYSIKHEINAQLYNMRFFTFQNLLRLKVSQPLLKHLNYTKKSKKRYIRYCIE